MSRILSWHLWPARNWPFDAAEEAQFVADLEDRADDLVPAERAGITAVMNALRCGATVNEVLKFLPGTSPTVLLAAYKHIEERRQIAASAWDAIVADPTPDTIRHNANAAARIAAVPTTYLAGLMTYAAPESLPAAVARLTGMMDLIRSRCTEVEMQLRTLPPRSDQARILARQLYDPHRPGLWSHPQFMPERVGELAPVRLADVLGERR